MSLATVITGGCDADIVHDMREHHDIYPSVMFPALIVQALIDLSCPAEAVLRTGRVHRDGRAGAGPEEG